MTPEAESATSTANSADEQPVEILVVDDSRVQAKVLKDLLQGNGYAVRVAGDGRQALEAVRQSRPSLVISDIIMPVLNGYEMCRTLKQDEALHDIPVILLTSLSDTEDIVLGLNAHADYYLTKPYSPTYLLTTIDDVLQKASQAPPDDSGGIQVKIGVHQHVVTASRRQMLNLLLSTYGNAVEQNRALHQAQYELKTLNEQMREQAQQIETQQNELRMANERLQALAIHDGLTGLKNHRAFKEKLEEELQRAARYGMALSLILLDIDAFKSFNDTFGHLAGDDALRQTARLLGQHSRATDFVARYGGEEFAILLPSTNSEWSTVLAERLRVYIEQTPWPQRAITASFGISTFDDRQVTKDSGAALIEAADKALYHSKRTGRNQVNHFNCINPN